MDIQITTPVPTIMTAAPVNTPGKVVQKVMMLLRFAMTLPPFESGNPLPGPPTLYTLEAPDLRCQRLPKVRSSGLWLGTCGTFSSATPLHEAPPPRTLEFELGDLVAVVVTARGGLRDAVQGSVLLGGRRLALGEPERIN